MSATYLVPVDFSDCSVGVVRHAGRMARGMGARLMLLHVVELPPTVAADALIQPDPSEDAMPALAFVLGDAERHMPIYLQLAEVEGLEVETVVLHGIPADVIAAEADRVDAAQIIMGTHGRTGYAKLMTGSVAESVVERTTRPVTLIRSYHKPTCEAHSCSWCNSGTLEAQDRLWTELDR